MSIDRILVTTVGFLFLSVCASAGAINQRPLRTTTIDVCGQVYKSAWVADTLTTQASGLMEYDEPKPSEAMIFIFPNEALRSFWMKNVEFDLDIAYFDANKKLVSVSTMRATSPLMNEQMLPGYPSAAPAQYAVEVRAGTFARLLHSSKRHCQLKIK